MTSRDRFVAARTVADAVLYEGYVLYPYRASSNKNQMRWQFGVLAPQEWAAAEGSERSANRTQLIVRAGDGAMLDVRIRCLQLQRRTVETALDAEGTDFAPIEALTVDDTMYVPFDEAVEHEIDIGDLDVGALVSEPREVDLVLPAASSDETLRGADGRIAGRLVRCCAEVNATVSVLAEPVSRDDGVLRVSVEVRNMSAWNEADASRDEALYRSLLAVHTLLAIEDGSFVSSFDPPDEVRAAVKACDNDGTFPVLIGEEGSDEVILSSPIILYDYPEIAPESPGDLYDGCEIDEILALRVLTLTEEEKAEARGTDARAAAIVDRCDDMPPEVWERLHGAVRSIGSVDGTPATMPPSSGGDPLAPWVAEGVGPGEFPCTTPGVPDATAAPVEFGEPPVFTTPEVPGTPGAPGSGSVPGAVPWWDPGADASVDPWSDMVVIDKIEVTKGTKVRLHPSHRADAHDLFVADQLATVAGVFHDVEENMHVAVTLNDDPATDMFEWQGRYLFFFPDEVEPVVSVEPG